MRWMDSGVSGVRIEAVVIGPIASGGQRVMVLVHTYLGSLL